MALKKKKGLEQGLETGSLAARKFLEIYPTTDNSTGLQQVFFDLIKFGESVPSIGRKKIFTMIFSESGHLLIDETFEEVDMPEQKRKGVKTTPLVWSVMYNTSWLAESVELLISLGANPDICDMNAAGPLFQISSVSFLDEAMMRTVEILLDNKANVMIKDVGGKTALHLAAFNGCCKLAELLIQRGANTEDKDNEGVTPLHAAAIRGNSAMVKLLLRHDVDVRILDNLGRTAESLAQAHGHSGIRRLIAAEDARKDMEDLFKNK